MDVNVVLVPEDDKPLLWDKLQDYILELTAYGTHQPVDGVFDYPWFDLYWREPNRFPFWAMVGGERTAFALVHCEERTEMAEFYSFPAFRRTGAALAFARQVVKRFPGPWTLSEYRTNHGAVAFWHKVIAPWPFDERVYIGGQGQERLEQTFTVPG
ncbi:MAG: hypothetical protein WDN03_14860 [Rhizomicrobium sp.]